MRIKFLGVRGSTPALSPQTPLFGTHTASICCTSNDLHLLFDAGSGIGKAPLPEGVNEIHLFFSHLHLDHVTGLPFYKASWNPKITFNLWAPKVEGSSSLKETFETLFAPPFFPIPFEKWSGNFKFHEVHNGEKIPLSSEVSLLAHTLNHPGGAMGYQLTTPEGRFAYISDTEHGNPEGDANILKLMYDADLVAMDAMYDRDSYAGHKGWGHATWEAALQFGKTAGVKTLGLIHHEPHFSDKDLLMRDEKIKDLAASALLIREGMLYDLATKNFVQP